MLDAKKRAELAQSVAALSEMCPPMWWGLFDGCRKEGFTDEQAMELVKVYIASQGSGYCE